MLLVLLSIASPLESAAQTPPLPPPSGARQRTPPELWWCPLVNLFRFQPCDQMPVSQGDLISVAQGEAAQGEAAQGEAAQGEAAQGKAEQRGLEVEEWEDYIWEQTFDEKGAGWSRQEQVVVTAVAVDKHSGTRGSHQTFTQGAPPAGRRHAHSKLHTIYWLHFPKTSSLFATTVLTHACGMDRVPLARVSQLTVSGPGPQRSDCGGLLSQSQCCGNKHSAWFHDPLLWPVGGGFPEGQSVVFMVREPTQRALSAFTYLHKRGGKCCGPGKLSKC